MENILDVYKRPYNKQEPVLCFDEKSTQLLSGLRKTLPTKPHRPKRVDYEYKREGVRNIFVAIEPQGGFRTTQVTKRRTKKETAQELRRIIQLKRYKNVKKLHIVLDNLNTHFESSFIETYGAKATKQLLKHVVFHYTPPHASWLNMAEIEIGILTRQCIKKRIPTENQLIGDIKLWQRRRNKQNALINWKFTKKDAKRVFKYEPK